MGRYPVQEPTVVAYHNRTAGEILQTVFQGAYRIDIHIVGRLVQKQYITFVLEGKGEMETVPFTTGKDAAELFLVGSGEIET